jgi:hypothetical protein
MGFVDGVWGSTPKPAKFLEFQLFSPMKAIFGKDQQVF